MNIVEKQISQSSMSMLPARSLSAIRLWVYRLSSSSRMDNSLTRWLVFMEKQISQTLLINISHNMSLLGLYLLSGFAFFLRIIYWAIIIDVVLSWMTLLGLHIVIGPLNSITRPLYDLTRKIFPTRVGMMDLAPLILILVLNLLLAIAVPFVANILR